MKDFDTLRDRVEATTQMLKSAQADRQDHTESLVGILRQLEEKHAAQGQQLVYYKKRLAPLEQANQQLAALMENLLDLIDSGFGDESLAPLRDASSMAAAMLRSDLFVPEPEMPARPAVEMREPAEDAFDEDVPEPEAAAVDSDEMAKAPQDDDVVAEEFVEQEPLVDAVGEAEEADETGPVAEIDESGDDAPVAESDLEMEEDALISLDELLDLASEESPEETVAFEDMDREAAVMADAREESEAPADDAIIDDGGFEAEFLADESDVLVASFEDVSDATLALEVEEDAADGVDDLPDVVKDAMAASEEDGDVDLVPEIPSMEDTAAMEDQAAQDDLETIAALAQQIEEETAGEGGTPPAQSDIRALLLRVEKLAKKAEAMRMAQGGTGEPRQPEKPRRRTGAAA